MATTLPLELWDTEGGGSLAIGKAQQAKLYGTVVELFAGFRDVWWTTDGTNSGTSLVNTGFCPMVSVLAGHWNDPRVISSDQMWGALFPRWMDLGRGQYSWEMLRLNSRWGTRVKVHGAVGDEWRAGGEKRRNFYLFCMAR